MTDNDIKLIAVIMSRALKGLAKSLDELTEAIKADTIAIAPKDGKDNKPDSRDAHPELFGNKEKG